MEEASGPQANSVVEDILNVVVKGLVSE
jgi:hypothetical protein